MTLYVTNYTISIMFQMKAECMTDTIKLFNNIIVDI